MGSYALYVNKSGKFYYPMCTLDGREVLPVASERDGAEGRLKEAIPEEKWEGLDSKIVDITVFLETIHKANVEVYELD